ncbi:hypothetical protein LZ30DRAFT_754797 [Colletotrichum cereale]|nr:hypothetical protein LZ30DRAFT_754797 [Colletotrichum cereale]
MTLAYLFSRQLSHITHINVDCKAYLWCLYPSPRMQFSQYRERWQPNRGRRATPLHIALALSAESTAKILMSWGAMLHYAAFPACTKTGRCGVNVASARKPACRLGRGLAFMEEIRSLSPRLAGFALDQGNSAIAVAIAEASSAEAGRA